MESGGEIQAYQLQITASEIVEISEESKSTSVVLSKDVDDVYVAVGKDDVEVVRWAIDHYPGTRINLVHVFSPITLIPTPVGRLSSSQLTREQVRNYKNDESNKRRNLLQEYTRLCDEAKVQVETMLVESNATVKAILELITVLNITNLVIGTKHQSSSRWLLKKGVEKGEFVKRNAPDYCEVTIVRIRKNLVDGQKVAPATAAIVLDRPRPVISRPPEKNHFLGCACFAAYTD